MLIPSAVGLSEGLTAHRVTGGRGGQAAETQGAFTPADLTSAARRGSPARLKLQDRKHVL